MSKTRYLDKYEPSYKIQCEVCGQTPTIVAVLTNGEKENIGMCGPCTWGEAKTIDPECWNDPVGGGDESS